MNIETLKAALIHALNFGKADHFLDTVCELHGLYDAGGIKALENALFMLTVDLHNLEWHHQKNQQELKEYRAESAAQARAEEARQAAEDRIRMEADRHRPRQAA